ncbi:unnamed protein product [Brachionus calyciflorus]|uniref:Uncharacterized protein n=1 Tax=Brachionus calyciflorus TaxID=104777 RepID=A0A814BR92_9BILA|nr:unnamed protein product [Brachionus calyciflorus]
MIYRRISAEKARKELATLIQLDTDDSDAALNYENDDLDSGDGDDVDYDQTVNNWLQILLMMKISYLMNNSDLNSENPSSGYKWDSENWTFEGFSAKK